MIGERLGKWIIYKELGRGGMGRVYLAQEEIGGRRAALKVLSAELAQEGGFLQRFQREIDTLSQLEHPHIVRFFESGFENGLYFYAMEYVDGPSLDDVLAREKRIPWKDVLDIAIQVCPALKHVHDHGVIHRDLKPANILRTSDGIVKLTDFGIAKVFAHGQLTATGGVVGTADYLSPEQAAGKPVTKRSDLYSLGAVLYTLLVGRPLFHGESFLDLLHKHRYAQFDPPGKIVLGLPYEIDEVVCELLEKDPGKRPPDCFVLGRQLETIRKKLERKNSPTQELGADVGTLAENKVSSLNLENEPGEATLMSRLIRQELDRQNRGGPISQLFDRWFVVLPLFLIVMGILVWTFWPRNHEAEANRETPPIETATFTEGERLFLVGEQLRLEGKIADARKLWSNLIIVYAGVPSEKEWTRKAHNAIAELDKTAANKDRLAPVWAALQNAAALRDEGRRDEAEAIWRGIEELYQNDPASTEILAQVKAARGQ